MLIDTRAKGNARTRKGQRMASDNTFQGEVFAIPGGESMRLCIQCGTCAGSCPNTNRMDYSPRKLVAMVRAGMKEAVLNSNSMWYCCSCYLCTVRCPRDIPVTDVMYVLKQLAIRDGYASKRGRTSNLSKTFVENVNKHGRVHEAELLLRYFFRIGPWKSLGIIPLGLKFLLRGRLPVRPHPIKKREQLRKVLRMAELLEGEP